MTTVPDLPIREHIELAHAHTQRAIALLENDEPQNSITRMKLVRAQLIFKALLTQNRFK